MTIFRLQLPPILLIILIALSNQLAAEEVRYVTDFIRFSLKESSEANSPFLTSVSSGEKVSVLETSDDGKQVKVRTESGKVGYLEARRLQDGPTYKLLYEELKTKSNEPAAALNATNKTAKGPASEATSKEPSCPDNNQQQLELENLRKELDTMRRTSSNAMKISAERNDLRKQLADLSREKAELEQQHMESSNNKEQNWFLIGAFVLLVGIGLGVLLPNLRLRKQKAYMSGF